MSFTDIAIKTGAYTPKALDTNNNSVNEFTRVTNTKSGVVQYEDFDFDENGAVDYRRSYLYTKNGKMTSEEFYTNSPQNNEKIWLKEKTFFDKILSAFGIETKLTLSDIDMEAMRTQADELTAQYVAEFGEEEEVNAESCAIIKAQINAINTAIAEPIDNSTLKFN